MPCTVRCIGIYCFPIRAVFLPRLLTSLILPLELSGAAIMASSESIDWNTAETSGQVLIGGRKLFLKAAGPPRTAGEPVIVVEAGLGDSSSGWAAVQPLVAKYARIFTYDRAGYGRSDPAPDPRTAEAVAKDLSALLSAAKITPPYIIVCHSYGGILAREFLALHVKDIAGMVFVDTNQEKLEKEVPMPFEVLGRVMAKLDYHAVIGMDREHKYTPEQYEASKADNALNEVGSGQESQQFGPNSEALGKKKQFETRILGNKPVVVIHGNTTKDLKKIYEASVDATDEDRAELLKLLQLFEEKDETLQKEQL
jgi:pimeloyl-ACP methyl ester carboxylesterase